jgi:hypothetical protein
MFRIFYAEKDATLYEGATTSSALSQTNTGLDEILEIGKRLGDDGETLLKSRTLVKFDMTEVSASIAKYSVNLNAVKFILQLYTTHAKNLPADFTLESRLVAQPWINGTGYLSSNPIINDGVQWAKPMASWSLDSQSGSLWISSSQQIQVAGTSLYVSGSGQGGSWLWQSGSGFFNTSSFDSSYFYQPGVNLSEPFIYRPTDLYMDVTDAVKIWISGSGGQPIENNGFILKFSDADEIDSTVTGYIRYFSRETHTIYVPRLTMLWDNSTFTTGSLTEIDIESYVTYTKIKPQYKDTEIAKLRIYARDKYPRKSPTNLFPTQTVKYLPTTTYYAIRDAATDEYIIPFDNIYNKVSCDSTSNFIYVDMNSFMPERYYRIELKLTDGITEEYIDDEIYFKVVR